MPECLREQFADLTLTPELRTIMDKISNAADGEEIGEAITKGIELVGVEKTEAKKREEQLWILNNCDDACIQGKQEFKKGREGRFYRYFATKRNPPIVLDLVIGKDTKASQGSKTKNYLARLLITDFWTGETLVESIVDPSFPPEGLFTQANKPKYSFNATQIVGHVKRPGENIDPNKFKLRKTEEYIDSKAARSGKSKDQWLMTHLSRPFDELYWLIPSLNLFTQKELSSGLDAIDFRKDARQLLESGDIDKLIEQSNQQTTSPRTSLSDGTNVKLRSGSVDSFNGGFSGKSRS